MSTHSNNCPSLHQVYQDLMVNMLPEDFKAFMCMLRSSQVCFLNQLLLTDSCQLQPQDCNTTVAGSEHDTVTHAEEEEEGTDSIFAETEDLQDWSDSIVLETASLPLATTSVLHCACCNSKEFSSAYPAIINCFGALFAEDNTVTPIWLRACYHSSYDMNQLIGEVYLYLHVTFSYTSGFSSQHVYTITWHNQYVQEVACIWALE
ncbi:hypothetical protein DSO57_1033406 [Entomophthora muscae]|uniref:Uncharacterized protein n=1 Tax=Entomophthora muscae TaxID=34485 RepID=A0ACC2TMU9_9FUNG|nr:hypothetical protein DSO57_1033406 [Entomophthora muscae]